MSEELMMKYFGCTDKSQLEAIRQFELKRRFYVMRNDVELKLLNWSEDVVNNVKSVINELNEFVNNFPPDVFNKSG